MSHFILAGVTSDQIIAISALASVVIALVLALNSWLKDRGERQDRERDEDRAEDRRYRELQALVEKKFNQVRDQVDHLTVSMVGRPADEHRGIPGVDGFVQRQDRHNKRVDEELRTSNGGGTIKGSLARLRLDVTDLKASVDRLVEESEAKP